MESKSQKASPEEDAGGDADTGESADAKADGSAEQSASDEQSERQVAAGEGTSAGARDQSDPADLPRMHQAAARLETAIADAERERHQWQELPAPVARHSVSELLAVAATTGAFVSVVLVFVLWGAGVLHFDAPSFLGGGTDAAAAQQEQRAGGGAMSAQRIGAAQERFSASERAVWNRDCRPLQEQLAGQGADALTGSERTTWRGQCRQMVANMLE